MATFKYELEKVLKLREDEERIRIQEHAKSLELLSSGKNIKDQKSKMLARNNIALIRSLCNNIDTDKIISINVYSKVLEREEQLAEEVVQKLEVEAEFKRLNLVNAVKKRKTLEMLKEKRKIEFIRQERKKEEVLIDEYVSFSFVKKPTV